MLVEITKGNFYNLVGLTKVNHVYSDKTQKHYAVLYYGNKDLKEFIEIQSEEQFSIIINTISEKLK